VAVRYHNSNEPRALMRERLHILFCAIRYQFLQFRSRFDMGGVYSFVERYLGLLEELVRVSKPCPEVRDASETDGWPQQNQNM
jgi:hypothetical protein